MVCENRTLRDPKRQAGNDEGRDNARLAQRVATVSVVLTVGSSQGGIPTGKKALSIATKLCEFGRVARTSEAEVTVPF